MVKEGEEIKKGSKFEISNLLCKKKQLSRCKDTWFYRIISFHLYSFSLSYGLCSLNKLSAETTLSWISVVLLFSVVFAMLSWSKIEKISQKVAKVDEEIFEELVKSKF